MSRSYRACSSDYGVLKLALAIASMTHAEASFRTPQKDLESMNLASSVAIILYEVP
jgi:tRNA(Leu) C34 or U34 (ribose-2'-O)-methylase TrmL